MQTVAADDLSPLDQGHSGTGFRRRNSRFLTRRPAANHD
jgi:hypothetical protein